jgi:hypothetical protein
VRHFPGVGGFPIEVIGVIEPVDPAQVEGLARQAMTNVRFFAPDATDAAREPQCSSREAEKNVAMLTGLQHAAAPEPTVQEFSALGQGVPAPNPQQRAGKLGGATPWSGSERPESVFLHRRRVHSRRGDGGPTMRDDDRMFAEVDPATLLTLHDGQTVRLKLPPLVLADLREPLNIHLDFDAETLDLVIARLKQLQARMRN